MTRSRGIPWGACLVGVAAIFAAACVEAPGEDQSYGSQDAVIALSGFVAGASAPVDVLATPDPRAAPVSVGRTTSSGTPRDPSASIQTFAWQASLALPADRWRSSSVRDPDGCALLETYVQVRSGGSPLRIAGDVFPLRLLRLLAYPTHTGDVSIATQAEAHAFRCVGKIVGNLTVAPSTDYRIALPKLHEVTGNVDLVYPARAVFGGATGSCLEVRRYEAPLLAKVGGNLTVTPQLGGSDRAVDFGLSAITSVGGTLTVFTTNAQTALAGLDGLVTAAGNVELRYQSDVGLYVPAFIGRDNTCIVAPSRPPLLDGLQTVNGDLLVRAPSDAYWVLPHLQLVHGDAVIEAKAGASFLPVLAEIEGNLTFGTNSSGMRLSGVNRVHGELRIEGSSHTAWPLRTTGTPVDVGGLSVLGNASLAELPPDALRFDPLTAAAVIQGNGAALTPTEICAFVTAQRGFGWTGALTTDPSVLCGPPPGLTYTEIAREFVSGLGFLRPEPRPAINGSGQVVFVGYDNMGGERLFVGSGGALTNVPLAPGGYDNVFNVRNDDLGRIAFTASRAPAMGAVQRGAYATDATGSFFTTIEEGPSFYDDLDPYVRVDLGLSPNGTVAFSTLRDGDGAVYRGPLLGPYTAVRTGSGQFYNSSALDVNDSGRVAVQFEYSQFMLRRGILLFDTPDPAFATLLHAIQNLSVGTQPTPSMNSAGQVAFVLPDVMVMYLNLDGSVRDTIHYEHGVYVTTPTLMSVTPMLTLIAGASGPYDTFGAVQINDAGVVTFEASPDAGEFGIYRGPDPVADKIAQSGELLEGTFVSWLRMGELNASGQLTFMTSDFISTDRQVWRVSGLNP